MTKCKFTFPTSIVGKGVCEVGFSRLYFDVVLYGENYQKLTIRVFPPKDDFTWSQLTSANCPNKWVRVNNHLEYPIHNFLCDSRHANMMQIENIFQNTRLRVYKECDHMIRPYIRSEKCLGIFPRTYFRLNEI